MLHTFKVLSFVAAFVALASCSDNSSGSGKAVPPGDVVLLEPKAFLLAYEPWTALQASFKEQEALSISIRIESERLVAVANKAQSAMTDLEHCFNRDTYGAQEVDACLYNLNGQNQIISNYEIELESVINRSFDIRNSFVDEIASYGRKCLEPVAKDKNLKDSEQAFLQKRFEEQCVARVSSIAAGALHYKSVDLAVDSECVLDATVSKAQDVSAALTTCESAIKISDSRLQVRAAFELKDQVAAVKEKIRVRLPFLKRIYNQLGIPK